jgi:hypothetical protein
VVVEDLLLVVIWEYLLIMELLDQMGVDTLLVVVLEQVMMN